MMKRWHLTSRATDTPHQDSQQPSIMQYTYQTQPCIVRYRGLQTKHSRIMVIQLLSYGQPACPACQCKIIAILLYKKCACLRKVPCVYGYFIFQLEHAHYLTLWLYVSVEVSMCLLHVIIYATIYMTDCISTYSPPQPKRLQKLSISHERSSMSQNIG